MHARQLGGGRGSLRIYNSLTRHKEPFDLPLGETVKIFVCGPTVYDYLHLGHARTYIAFDVIARYLKFLGYNVRFLMNITDVAERLVQRAEEVKMDPLELARQYEKAFLEDMQALGIDEIERYERASDYIPQIIDQVKGLIDRGVAYETNTGVYFEVAKFPKFGQLSGQTKQELGLRRLELCSSKRKPEDFSLWRKHENGFGWPSPWGFGRPGWHVEDTAISMTHFGETYHIHGGASELVFPHHEAEIAQAEALSGKVPFVQFWLHTGLLNVSGRKMSKSLGNVVRIRDALKQNSPAELRFYFASSHYREPVVISETGLKRVRHTLRSLVENFRSFSMSQTSKHSRNARDLMALVRRAEDAFRRHMDNDFDTPKALDTLVILSKRLSRFARASKIDDQAKKQAETVFQKIADVFGILPG